MSLKNGYIHIYTGDGKGKTTAAAGLAARALGAGLKVWFGQFIKGTPSSEFKTLSEAGKERFVHRQFGRGCFIVGEPSEEDRAKAEAGLSAAQEAFKTFDIVILDEVLGALQAKLFSPQAVSDVLKVKPEGVEIVLTGRNAPQELIDCADLVSQIREVKHYYTQGVNARKGIEF